jgi:F-type H+-transporting ATPase subunit gamma
MITSNRGLCGGYNTFIFKKAIARIIDLNNQGIVPKLLIVGKKGDAATVSRMPGAGANFNYTGTFVPMPDTITAKTVSAVTDEMLNLFLSGEVDKVEVLYSKFINLLTSQATIRSVLPLSPTGIEDPDDETFVLTSEEGKLKAERKKVDKKAAKNIENDVIFDQPPEVILNSMLPLYLSSQLLSMLFDSQASELSARMNAMQAATDNAKPRR